MKTAMLLAACGLTTLASCSAKKQEAPKQMAVTENAGELSASARLANTIQNYEGLPPDERLALAEKLIGEGADVNSENQLGEPILGDAVHFADGKWDDFRLVQLLVKSGADVNASGRSGRSPLTKAAEAGKIDVLRLFFENGLEINNENGTRAVVKAAYRQQKGVLDLFLARGFRPHGKYEETLLRMKSEETEATAALFGAYVDLVKEELQAMLRDNPPPSRENFFSGELAQIERSCKAINSSAAINNNMSDYFNRAPECSSMGRLGSLAYMHCYGLQKSNSARLPMLQERLAQAVGAARAPLRLEGVSFAALKGSSELLSHDASVRASMALYADVLLPALGGVQGRMSHHTRRNRQLREQATHCGNKAILKGAGEIHASIAGITGRFQAQEKSFGGELARLQKIREKIAYQLPALGATETLRKREEEERKKQAEEPAPRP